MEKGEGIEGDSPDHSKLRTGGDSGPTKADPTMKNVRPVQVPLGAFLYALCALQARTVDTANTDAPLLICFVSRAAHVAQALVMGNGMMGISIFGGVGTDSIYLNDITLWFGEPVADHLNPKAQRYIPLIRKALEGEDYQAADSLSRFVQGPFSQSYLPLGTLYIEHHGQGE